MGQRHDDAQEVYALDRAAFRSWLEENSGSAPAVWLVYFKKTSGRPSIDYEGAVREALCFGWIDGKVQRLDEDRYRQLFTPRKTGSTWSATNKKRVSDLEKAGLLAPAGSAVIEAARADGSWVLLDDVEALIEPEDLARALDARPQARRNYDGFPDSSKKAILWLVKSAKRPSTREARIRKVVERALDGRLPS